MLSKLNTETAVIKTASVEVKTLTISGKQVTLAVFRQLQDEAIIVEQSNGLELSGTPWGKVNYHFNKCEDYGEHLHIVWQKASELRRSTVPKKIPPWLVEQFVEEEKYNRQRVTLMVIGFLLLTFAETGALNVPIERVPGLIRVQLDDDWWAFNKYTIAETLGYPEIWSAFDGLARFLSGNYNFSIDDIYFGIYHGDDTKCAETLRRVLYAVIVKSDLGNNLPPDPSTLNTASKFRSAAQRFNEACHQSQQAKIEWTHKWSKLYSDLSSLDHLFIAV